MLKVRIIGVVLVKNGIVVQSIQFKNYLPIGKPEIAIRYLDQWGVDEIVILNLDGASNDKSFTTEQVRSYAKQCHVPLAIGGGLRDIQAVKKVIRAGADKIILNTAAMLQSSLITSCSELFGQQCVIISIDTKRNEKNESIVYYGGGKINSMENVTVYAKKMQDLGAGEIFLTSIDQDGTKQGYDLPLIQNVSTFLNIPVIACGGAGHPKHAYDAILSGASAIAVGNYFHFIEHSVILFKKYLMTLNAPVRSEGYVSYRNNPLDESGRVIKHTDDLLSYLRFQRITEEII